MIKKIFFQLVFFNLFFLKEVFAAESGGMPQLNPDLIEAYLRFQLQKPLLKKRD